MTKVTQNDLLQYLYNECSPKKCRLIHQLLPNNDEIQERLNNLYAVNVRLDRIKLVSPDIRSVDNILNYSKRAIDICL